MAVELSLCWHLETEFLAEKEHILMNNGVDMKQCFQDISNGLHT